MQQLCPVIRRSICRERTRTDAGILSRRRLPMGAPTTEVPQRERAQVRQLIANGKFGHAVDIAKQVHKRVRNAASEALLVEAYAARIKLADRAEPGRGSEGAAESGAGGPPFVARPVARRGRRAGSRGRGVEGLMELLADPSLPAEKRAATEVRIRDEAGDPARIARCEALPADHRLARGGRGGGSRVGGGHERAGGGRESGSARNFASSPMAPWKMMIRAIAAFYADEDELCEKYLAAVEPKAAAARLVPALRALMGREADTHTGGRDSVEAGGRGHTQRCGRRWSTWTRPWTRKITRLRCGKWARRRRCAKRLARTCWSGSSSTFRFAPCWPVRIRAA